MYEARQALDRERGEPTLTNPYPTPRAVRLPALDQVTGWSKADPTKVAHDPDVALFGGWRLKKREGSQGSKSRVVGRAFGPPAGTAWLYLLRSTCSNSSSTGVARPKIDTETFTRLRSKSSSSTSPLKVANGPSRTLTWSPIS